MNPTSPALAQVSCRRLALGSAIVVTTALLGIPIVNAVASTPSSPTVTLHDVVPGLATLTDLGPVSSDLKMTVGVTIPGNIAAAKAAYTAITTKGSPDFGQTYTPDEWNAAFGVDPAVSLATQKTLEAKGLKPVYVSKDGGYFELSGTAAQVEKTFSVTEHRFFATSNSKIYYANLAAATVPAVVSHLGGLTDLDNMTTDATQDTCEPALCTGDFSPPGIWSTYDEPDDFATKGTLTGNLGQGQKVAIFGEGDLSEVVSDLRQFEDETGVGLSGDVAKPKLPHIPIREVLVNDDQSDKTGADEWDLDSQSSTGMSPDLAELDYYFGEDLSDTALEGIYNAWVDDSAAPAIGNSSFGGCELLEGALGDEAADDAIFMKAVMEGKTMFVSAGDTGSGGCVVDGAGLNGVTQGAPSVEYPSASPYVVAVGGSVLYSTASTAGAQVEPATRALEYAWTYTGGGSADYEPQPSDQAALGGTLPVFQPCLGNGDTGSMVPTGATCRSVPDVAALSGDVVTNGYAVVIAGADTATGGTSLSSPLWAGMWARVRAAHPTDGSCATIPDSKKADLGFAQLDLYDLAESSTANDTSAFFDIGGTTDSEPSGNGMYVAYPRTPTVDPTGFDQVSGLGTPDVSGIAKILDCSLVPTSTAVPPATGNSVTVTGPPAAVASTCPPNGTEMGDTGVTPVPDSALQILSVADTSNATAVTFTETLAALPESDPLNEDVYDSDFTYDNVAYYVEYDDGGGGGTASFMLYAAATGTGLTASATSLATLTGSENDTTGVITVVMPLATFNSTAKPATALAPGAVFSAMEVVTDNELSEDTATFGACTFTLAGDVTTPATPSATPSSSTSPTATPSSSTSPTATPTSSPSPSVSPSTSSPSPSVSPSTSSPSPSVSPSTSSPSPSVSPSTSSPSPSVSPSTSSPSPSPTPTTTYSAAPVPTFPTYATPTPTTPTPTTTSTTITATTPPTRFHPLSYNVLNSRTVANGHDESVKIVGVSGVPTTNVVDVLLQVTADQATATAPVLVDSDFGTHPAQQAVTAVPGKAVRNVILVTPDNDGVMQIEVTNGAKARIALAVVGYDSLGAGDGFHPTFGGRVSATLTKVTTSKKPLAVVIGGKGGVPAGSLDAALLDARVSSVALPKKVTSAILYATVGGTSKKTAIATITSSGTTTSLLVVRPDSHGKVTFSLSAGSAKIVVNEYGTWASAAYTAAHSSSANLRFGHPMSALTEYSGNLGTGTRTVTLTGLPTVGVSTVILQITVGYGASAGEVALATTGARFGDGSVSYLPGQGSVQLVSIAPDNLGRVSLHTTKGSRAVTLALVGYTALS